MTVRCPQCGTVFDKDANEFCPNPPCGYPSAFIGTPKSEGPESQEMLRRPGEEATAPLSPTAPPGPTAPAASQPTRVLPAVPAPVAPLERRPTPRRFPMWGLVAAGVVAGLVILIVVLLLAGGGGSTTATGSPTVGTTVSSGQARLVCTTAFFPGSLGDRALGPCPNEMQGNDVEQLQQQLTWCWRGCAC
jgi:hypothetical protein